MQQVNFSIGQIYVRLGIRRPVHVVHGAQQLEGAALHFNRRESVRASLQILKQSVIDVFEYQVQPAFPPKYLRWGTRGTDYDREIALSGRGQHVGGESAPRRER